MESTQNLLNELISIKERYERLLGRFSLLIDNDGNRKGGLTCITAERAGSDVFNTDANGGSALAAGVSLNFAW
jgi:hypothetical protein